MRISDWSSDVCSSDLEEGGKRKGCGDRRGCARTRRRTSAGAQRRHERRIAVGDLRQSDAGRSGVEHPEHGSPARHEIGRASCRERECRYVLIPVVGVLLKKNNKNKTTNAYQST